MDDMGTLRTIVRVAHIARPDEWRELPDVMVDTGSEYNWIPAPVLTDLGITPARVERFETADGSVIERDIGFALLGAGGRTTATIVVFAGEGDMVLLGAIGIEGMNLRVDLVGRELVPAGPVPVAAACGPATLAA
jgi:predicted aspartyl protease